jgi:phytoene synthase
MAKQFEKKAFKSASKTFYYSTRFFPKRLRRDIARLYSFVRIADDYVDEAPTQPEKISDLEKQYSQALKTEHYDPTTHSWDDQDTRIVKNMVRLTQRYKFEPDWVPAFLGAMKSDIKPKAMVTLQHSLDYVHGSAEVVGLMMAKLMKLPEEAWEAARLQGRAMQWLNFIRDLKEDQAMGRQYFPDTDLKAAGLKDLSEETARDNPEAFKKFIDMQIKRYRDWQAEAEKGYEHIPKHLRVPLQTSVEMFNWTADVIEKNPFIVYKKKVRPVSGRVLGRGVVKKLKSLKADLRKH